MKVAQPLEIGHKSKRSGKGTSKAGSDLALVISSVRTSFEQDAQASLNGMFDLHERTRTVAENDTEANVDVHLTFASLHRLLEDGFHSWVGTLRKIAGDQILPLAKIALAHPDWSSEEPAVWGRRQARELLSCWLVTEGFPDRIKVWFQQVCDGPGDFDQFETGRPEPWCAPAWAARAWTRDSMGIDERLTPDGTRKLLLNRRAKLDLSVEYALEKAEHEVRINVATQPDGGDTNALASVAYRAKGYSSPLKRTVMEKILVNPDASDKHLCRLLDNADVELPPNWQGGSDRTFYSAYMDSKRRPKIETFFSKVRKDLRDRQIISPHS